MEDDAKEDAAQCKEPVSLNKAGWLKKDTGRLFSSYKDRYICVEKTEVLVYEKEDLQICLERLDLENYDKCHELKSPFKKKQRLVLVPSPKSEVKVHYVKFQAQTAEEKEAWIKALNEGISRAKNKVFDEVKIDESCNLEHVTRTRPKGNRNRRPPTRIHMKEIAIVSSDGIQRLDLDLENALMPNGTHHPSVDGTGTSKEALQVPVPLSGDSEAYGKQLGPSADEVQTEPEVSPQKKVIKPPMPSTKEAKPIVTAEEEPDGVVKKVLKVPMPPSKEPKSCVPVEEATEKGKDGEMSEQSHDSRKKAGPPPTPPNKPSSSSSMRELAEDSQSRSNSQPPVPPSKEKKPHVIVESDQEVQGANDEIKKLPSVRFDESEGPSAEDRVSEDESEETVSSGINKSSVNESQTPTDPLRNSPSPVLHPQPENPVQPGTQDILDNTTQTHPTEEQDPTALLQRASVTSASSEAQEALPKNEVPLVVVSFNDLVTDSLSLSPVLFHCHEEKKKKAEEKSVDSGQHSDDNSEGSGSEDTLAASTTAMRGSHAGLDMLDASEDDIQISVHCKGTQAESQVRSEVLPRQGPKPPLKPSPKARSASFENLLSGSSVCIQVRPHTRAVGGNDDAPRDDVRKLEAEVSQEMEETSELLSSVSQFKSGGDVEDVPENLLVKAMEKLQKADHVLREVKKLKPAKNSMERKSW